MPARSPAYPRSLPTSPASRRPPATWPHAAQECECISRSLVDLTARKLPLAGEGSEYTTELVRYTTNYRGETVLPWWHCGGPTARGAHTYATVPLCIWAVQYLALGGEMPQDAHTKFRSQNCQNECMLIVARRFGSGCAGGSMSMSV